MAMRSALWATAYCTARCTHHILQCGFALLEAGSVRLKNTKNILLKNVVNTCISAITWWAIGTPVPAKEHAFSYGSSPCNLSALALCGTAVQQKQAYLECEYGWSDLP